VLTVDAAAGAPAADAKAPAETAKPEKAPPAEKAEPPAAEAKPPAAPPKPAPGRPEEATHDDLAGSESPKEEATPSKVVDISRGGRQAPAAAAQAVPAPGGGGLVPAAPSTRRYARELGVDITEVEGSGPGGRISQDDVKAHARALIQSGGGRVGAVPLPDFSQWGEVEVQPMRNIRRITAERLSAAWATVPHVTQFDKADITELEKLRQKYAKKVEQAGGKLTITAIALKVVAAALKAFPQFNSAVDMKNQAIVLKKYVNVGIAVDTDRGLLVPVVRDVDRKNIVELSVELQQIAEKARAGKLQPGEVQGGGFSISNLGGIGGTYFTPIINAPEVAILGMSRAVMEPVWIDGRVEARLMMPLSLSYDHRVIDGADGIRFLRWVCE